MCTLPPSPCHRSPPPPPRLIEDLIPEILLRIPPADPACLVRASLADPGFLRRYRAFHRTPPMLGFISNSAHFIPTTSFRPAAPNRRGMYAISALHGRVLLRHNVPLDGLAVWDPVTDEQWAVPPLPAMAAAPAPLSARYEGIVFCAAAGCDHLDCHGGPFAVALVGSWAGLGCAIGCVYSSESGEWGEPVAALPGTSLSRGQRVPVGNVFYVYCLLVGNVFYFTCKPGWCSPFIVEYDMASGKLSTFGVPSPPSLHKRTRRGATGGLTVTEGGRLGFACVFSSELFLWYWEAGPSGAMAWKLRRNIQLNTMRSSCNGRNKAPSGDPYVIGFADGAGVGVVLVRTETGAVFSVDLKSARARKTSLPRFHGHEPLLPYLSFYTPVAGPSMKSLQIEEVVISDGDFLGDNKKQSDIGGDVDVQVQHSGDADKQRLMGKSVDEQRQVLDAIDEQQKLKNQEVRRQKQENKKRKLDLKKRRKKSAKIRESKRITAEGGVSCSARKLSRRVTKSRLGWLPSVRSPGLNMLTSAHGVLASVAASKEGGIHQ